MRITKLLRILLGLEETRVVDVGFDEAGLVVDVTPTWRRPRCSECDQICPGYDHARDRRWRHLDVAGMQFHLRYDTRRVNCPRCGVKLERLPWAEPGSWFTRPFEDHVGYLAQRCDKTTISSMMRVAWDTVGAIIQRVVARRNNRDALEDLRLLTGDSLDQKSPFALVLAGQPLLRERLAEPVHYALAQRITVRARLRPLTDSELTLFLDKHLRAAGAKSNLFEPDAVTLVFQHSRGIPRLAQNLALGALLVTATANKKTVDADAVQQALLDQEAS